MTIKEKTMKDGAVVVAWLDHAEAFRWSFKAAVATGTVGALAEHNARFPADDDARWFACLEAGWTAEELHELYACRFGLSAERAVQFRESR